MVLAVDYQTSSELFRCACEPLTLDIVEVTLWGYPGEGPTPGGAPIGGRCTAWRMAHGAWCMAAVRT